MMSKLSSITASRFIAVRIIFSIDLYISLVYCALSLKALLYYLIFSPQSSARYNDTLLQIWNRLQMQG